MNPPWKGMRTFICTFFLGRESGDSSDFQTVPWFPKIRSYCFEDYWFNPQVSYQRKTPEIFYLEKKNVLGWSQRSLWFSKTRFSQLWPGKASGIDNWVRGSFPFRGLHIFLGILIMATNTIQFPLYTQNCPSAPHSLTLNPPINTIKYILLSILFYWLREMRHIQIKTIDWVSIQHSKTLHSSG